MNWGEGYFKDRVLKVQSPRGLWITSLNFLLKIFKLLRSLQIAHLVTMTLRARGGNDLIKVTQPIVSASGLDPTWNQSSFHSAMLTRKSDYWLITQLICSIPSDKEGSSPVSCHSFNDRCPLWGFLFCVCVCCCCCCCLVQGKVRGDGEKRALKKDWGNLHSKKCIRLND